MIIESYTSKRANSKLMNKLTNIKHRQQIMRKKPLPKFWVNH